MSQILNIVSGDRDTIGSIAKIEKRMSGDGIIEFRGDLEYFWEDIGNLQYELKSITKMREC